MATWTPPADAVETSAGWAPPSDAVVSSGQVAAQPPKSKSSGVIANIFGSVVEPVLQMGTGLIAKPVSEVMGMAAAAKDVLTGTPGDAVGFKEDIANKLTYEPRTQGGEFVMQRMLAPIGGAIESGAQGIASSITDNPIAQSGIKETALQGLGFLGVKGAPKAAARLEAGNDAFQAARAAKRVQRSVMESSADWQRSAVIDAAKVARENKIVLNPSSVTEGGRTIRMAAAGGSPHFNTAASIANKNKWNELARQDLGLGKDVPLTAETYNRVRKIIAKPYDEATSLGALKPDEAAITAIREIDVPEILPAGEQAAGKMRRITDTVAEQLEGGMTGKDAVNTTRTLRSEAKSVFDSVRAGNQVDHVTVQTAKAKMAIAEKIDETISSNITDPKWKAEFDKSRRKMAQSYAYERATNLVRRQIDPQVFAQEMQGRHMLTGNAAKMGEIAGNFPEIANVYAEKGSTFGMPVRSGVAGTAGFAVGSLYGAPVATSAAAATLSAIGEKAMGRKLRTEPGQAKYATPKDRRIPIPENSFQRGMLTGTEQ